jgi:hypothetical protein
MIHFTNNSLSYSRQALKKYVHANNVLGNVNDATFTSLFNRALAKGSESGVFARPKGTSSQRSTQRVICRVSQALVHCDRKP